MEILRFLRFNECFPFFSFLFSSFYFLTNKNLSKMMKKSRDLRIIITYLGVMFYFSFVLVTFYEMKVYYNSLLLFIVDRYACFHDY